MNRKVSRREFTREFTLGAMMTLLPAGELLSAGEAAQAAANSSVTLISGGKPTATLVTSDTPTEPAKYAAQELAYHLEKATGSRPAIITESAAGSVSNGSTRIFLGDTLFARKAGVRFKTLAPESCVIRTVGKDLCIAGLDYPGDPMEPNTSAGTLFGVYEILEKHLGVRWLWPGELGTHVPKTQTLVIPVVDQVVEPRFFQRHVRTGAGMKSEEHPAMGFTAKAGDDYIAAQQVFLRRHRMGRRQPTSYGHAFVNWWEKYGGQHPEWFQLVNGKRGPAKSGARFSMCVSNSGLKDEILTLAKGKKGQIPPFINAVENDIPGSCECDQCRALDGPEPSDYRKFIPPKSKIAGKPFESDRYAKFWLDIQQRAAKENPNATVVGYAYFNYFCPPTSGVKLNQNILIGFCPSGWFYPRADDEHDWMKRQWRGWSDTGAQVFMRTNYFLDGYCMPYVFAHQFADDFQNAAKNRLVGTDFDSLTGQWATQGPNLYLLMRLQTRPDMAPDAVLAEYYSGFGPAANDVRAYFDHWEAYTMNGRPNLNKSFETLEASRWRSFAKAAHAVFPEESFASGEALLAKAAVSAAGNAEAAERVKFLQLGLEHAKLCSVAGKQLTLGDPASTPERGKAALEALLKFRRAHERTWISNMNQCAWVEDFSWKLSNETKQTPDLYP